MVLLRHPLTHPKESMSMVKVTLKSFLYCAISYFSIIFLQGGVRPRLIVVISVDQLSAHSVARYQKQWSHGLKSLFDEGVVFSEAYQSHASTETAPGHATIMSGRYPSQTGIVSNTWFGPGFRRIDSTEDDQTSVLLAPAGRKGASGTWFSGTTLGDWLIRQNPRSRVMAISGKDRASIFMAGTSTPDVYWFEPFVGFTTSMAYQTDLPSWLQEANQEWLQSLERQSLSWTPSNTNLSSLNASTYLLDGDYLGERVIKTGLPKLIKSISDPLDSNFYKRFRATPFYDQLILQFAQKLIEKENLGQGSDLDILMVGLSGTDYVGHNFGTGGAEMQDHLLRLDQSLGAFIKFLKSKDKNVAIILTADHGAPDFAERLHSQGLQASRESYAPWLKALNEAVQAKLTPGRTETLDVFRVTGNPPSELYINSAALGMDSNPALRATLMPRLMEIVKSAPHVMEVFSREEIEKTRIRHDQDPRTFTMAQRFHLSYNARRSGDIFIVFKPYMTWGMGGSQHGSPMNYDRHVPLVFWGPWQHEIIAEGVEIVDLAPTLASEFDIKPLQPLDGKILKLQRKGNVSQ
jgi:predicted AlkP superfamily pyrophosphatase or phosphodiesterase